MLCCAILFPNGIPMFQYACWSRKDGNNQAHSTSTSEPRIVVGLVFRRALSPWWNRFPKTRNCNRIREPSTCSNLEMDTVVAIAYLREESSGYSVPGEPILAARSL